MSQTQETVYVNIQSSMPDTLCCIEPGSKNKIRGNNISSSSHPLDVAADICPHILPGSSPTVRRLLGFPLGADNNKDHVFSLIKHICIATVVLK